MVKFGSGLGFQSVSDDEGVAVEIKLEVTEPVKKPPTARKSENGKVSA